jgi:transposase
VPRQGEKSRIESEPADHALGLSHGGIGTKLHLATEGRGLPLGFVLTAGNRNECPTFDALMSVAKRWRARCRWPRKLAADKGYSSDRLRLWLRKRRIAVVIPMRDNEHVSDRDCFGRFDKRAYRKRNVVERCVGWLKNCRRLCTRFEKLAVNFAAMVTLAMIVMYLRQPL